jgi:hypothetical protein
LIKIASNSETASYPFATVQLGIPWWCAPRFFTNDVNEYVSVINSHVQDKVVPQSVAHHEHSRFRVIELFAVDIEYWSNLSDEVIVDQVYTVGRIY